MSITQIDFYYFSGTGNTELVVKKMRDVFASHKIPVSVNRIEKSDPKKINLNNTIGIAFPVAMFSTYPLVWDFVKALPEANGNQVFMVDTCGASSYGGVIGHMKSVLKKKGYRPLFAKEIVMPENIFFIEPEEVNKKKIEKGLKKAGEYAGEIIAGGGEWRKIPVWSDAMYWFAMSIFWLAGLKIHQKIFLFKVDRKKCTKCGLCAALCPVKNIEMKGYPVYGYRCQYCLRCSGICSVGAIPVVYNCKKKSYKAPGAEFD